MSKLLIELRRRAWVVALAVALTLAGAWALAKALPTESSAEAVLVVRAGGRLAEQPDPSTRLASTYSKLIPIDAQVEAVVGPAFPDADEWSFDTTNDPNTAVLRLVFTAGNEEDAIEGAKTIARAVSGSDPASENIRPGTVAVVSLPDSASTSGGTGQIATVGLFMGLLVGLVTLAYWRRRDVRVDTLAEARQVLDCPCFELRADGRPDLSRLVHALEIDGSRSIAVVPCQPREVATANFVFEGLRHELANTKVDQAENPGSAGAGELIAAHADTSILVVAAGARAADVGHAVDILDRYGAAPGYALFARGRARGAGDGRGPGSPDENPHPVS